MKVLIGCERSGVVRNAFRALGHDAWSCDILPSDDNSVYHYQCNVIDIIESQEWDLAIFHPPCTDICVSGARWFKEKIADGRQDKALEFVRALMDAPIHKIAIENPVSVISSKIRQPDQTIQPWQFGHGEVKKTCLWLKNLPLLRSTNIVAGRIPRIHYMKPSKNRSIERSLTYTGIAQAMAEQWGI